MILTHSEIENLCPRDASKYWNDLLRSGHAGGNVENGPEGKKLKAWRPEKINESIGSLGSFVFYLYFSKSKI